MVIEIIIYKTPPEFTLKSKVDTEWVSEFEDSAEKPATQQTETKTMMFKNMKESYKTWRVGQETMKGAPKRE